MLVMPLKWGHSLGLRIPQSIVKEMRLSTKEPVELTLEGNHVVIKKANRLNLLLAQITPENIHSEVDI